MNDTFPQDASEGAVSAHCSDTVLEAQWDRVGHMTSSDRCKRQVGRDQMKSPRCLLFRTRTLPYVLEFVNHDTTPSQDAVFLLFWVLK